MYLPVVWKPVNISSGRGHHPLSPDHPFGLAQSTFQRAASGNKERSTTTLKRRGPLSVNNRMPRLPPHESRSRRHGQPPANQVSELLASHPGLNVTLGLRLGD